MTDEIYKECHDVWISKTGWGWSFEEFKSLLGRFNQDEEVTLECGQTVYGSDISYWFRDLRSFEHGWICAYEHLLGKGV